jgi:hypothetical protein
LSLLGLAVLFVALRWNNLRVPLVRDEGEYAYSAQLLLHGHGALPYRDAFLQKPPMVVYGYALAGLLAPGHLWASRITSAVFAALATLLTGWVARREFGVGVGLTAMWLLTAMIVQPGIEQFTANTEMFLVLPLLATIAVSRGHWSRTDTESSDKAAQKLRWFLAGALGALTFWYKYTALPLLLLIFAMWIFREWRLSGRAALVRIGLALLGGVVATAAAIGVFLMSDGGRHLWECTVQFNRYYAASQHFGWKALATRLDLYWGSWWILCLLPLVLFFRRVRGQWFWFGLFAVAWLTTGGSWYGHYYILLMPFWAVLAAVALRELASLVAPWLGLRPASIPGARAVLAIGTLALVLWPDLPWMLRSEDQFARDKLGPPNPFLESPIVAEKVAALTQSRPSEPVFVAGSEPQILCYAHRRSASRFVISYPLMIPTPLAIDYQHEVIAALERQRPAVVVFSRLPTSWTPEPTSPGEITGYLDTVLNRDYATVGGYVWKDGQGQWLEPLPAEEGGNASLVVFARKR